MLKKFLMTMPARFNVKLIGAILLCQSAGVIGSLFTASAIPTWYVHLAKPEFAPPNWLFAPVWLTLYTLMGISLYRIWKIKKKTTGITYALHLFYIHLFLNTYWSIVFFGIKDIVSALIILVALVIMIGILVIWFYRYDKVAGLLLIPYFLWASLATYLNYSIWRLNA